MNTVVYQHVKPNGEIFYIGIGYKSRAFEKRGRNKFWYNIVNKYNYTIEIIHENLSWELASQIETHLISLYGRRDLNLGNLCNLTDGGEGTRGYNHKIETRLKMSLNHSKIWKNKKHKIETRKLMSENSKGSHNHRSKKVINIINNKIYDCVKDASVDSNIEYHTLKRRLNNPLKNNTNLKYL